MQVQELNDLANWFKKNVLDLSETDTDFMLEEPEDTVPEHNIRETVTPPTPVFNNVVLDEVRSTVADVNERDEDLSMLKFIIGIDQVYNK